MSTHAGDGFAPAGGPPLAVTTADAEAVARGWADATFYTLVLSDLVPPPVTPATAEQVGAFRSTRRPPFREPEPEQRDVGPRG